ncbi:MAG TPA: hypothetical protein ENH82_14620 [bacterium]|nr:hypothetical protein [bacterium]
MKHNNEKKSFWARNFLDDKGALRTTRINSIIGYAGIVSLAVLLSCGIAVEKSGQLWAVYFSLVGLYQLTKLPFMR